MMSFGAETKICWPGIRAIKTKKQISSESVDLRLATTSSSLSKSLPELDSCNIWLFTWEAGSAEVGSWQREIHWSLPYMLSNNCWNGVSTLLYDVNTLHSHSDSSFPGTVTGRWWDMFSVLLFVYLFNSGSICERRLCLRVWETHDKVFTCVFVFVSQQRATLLEDLVAQVAGVHAAVRLLHPLPLRAWVRVVVLLHGGHALGPCVLLLFL